MKQDFFQFQAPTTPFAPALEVSHARGNYIYDVHGNEYLDCVAGVSALPLGHCHPAVTTAIKKQVDLYMHVMVYGEYAQEPAVELCKKIAQHMPEPLQMTYLVNSGTEAMEAAIKLARRVTGRSELISMQKAYHGNTMGSLSLMDYEERKAPFRPLLPQVKHIKFNCMSQLNLITSLTAAVIIESIQGGAGFIIPHASWLKALKTKCEQTGALLIIDEIQPGMGRTGSMFYFTQHDIIPDMVITGKGLAGGLPIGALTASVEHLNMFKEAPMLGHITTFGGNPVIASAALATMTELEKGDLIKDVRIKELRFRESLKNKNIKEIRGTGLMLAAILSDDQYTAAIVDECRNRGVIFFLLLFEKKAVRITPPLTITQDEITKSCAILNEVINEFYD
ncbi:aspartate aminotransferase family protein [Nonlabens ulvanivorans]|uniref:Acetylornithine aminotransferase n=1 Tax=Nonlabens ulvanivorans TaxID=906888 RepID=A0A084JVZ7_NONUL|nr:aspartate aminotransferase family protein [Nonlabens ulvanivorans]KEZ93131.1 aminotransferase class III [Nonlabens ulvanivorans]PRX13749.1 acetylornithine aminotransferase [Nonlabens ulvanivorans]